MSKSPEIQHKKEELSESHQHSKENEEASRAAAYGRVAARIPAYVTKAMTAARPLAYASEVGESMRGLAPYFVKPLYALSIAYVIGDVAIKTYEARDKNFMYRKWYFIDLSLWHLGASLVFPALLIHKFVKTTTFVMSRSGIGSTKVLKFIPAVSALCLIPFIVHPLDHFTDWLMDSTLRQYVRYAHYDTPQDGHTKH